MHDFEIVLVGPPDPSFMSPHPSTAGHALCFTVFSALAFLSLDVFSPPVIYAFPQLPYTFSAFPFYS